MSSTFATWLRAERTRHGLSVVGLAAASGVAAASISRLEHAQVEPTALSGLRLAAALGVSRSELVQALGGRPPRALRESGRAYELDVLTLEPLEAWLASSRRDWRATREGLATAINRVLAELGSGVVPWAAAEVERLLDASPLYDCALRYPPQVSLRLVQELYRAGALLLPDDLGVYLRAERGRRTQAQLARDSGLARGVISRLELGQLERSKLADVLSVDQALGARGELLGLLWQARPFLEPAWTPREQRLLRLRLLLDRWARVLELPEHSVQE